ncbi:MAG: hypothetical protein QM485_06905 [Flavobacteriaceae bacterium]
MKAFLKTVSYLFHPLFIPIAGTIFYFMITPKYSSLELQSGTIFPIFILTIIIPIISFIILKNIGLASSIFMPTIRERKYPLYIHITLLLMVLYKVIPNNYTIELYYFFLGLLSATMASLLLLFLRFKSSMHLTGMGSLYMFLICLSIHFELNIILTLSSFTLLIGLVATSRLYFKAHNKAELLISFIIGMLSQLLTIKFWL